MEPMKEKSVQNKKLKTVKYGCGLETRPLLHKWHKWKKRCNSERGRKNASNRMASHARANPRGVLPLVVQVAPSFSHEVCSSSIQKSEQTEKVPISSSSLVRYSHWACTG